MINIGVAAHITAASTDGPRFDSALTPEERRSVHNGIWLCQTCAKLVDNDESRYTVDILRRWKTISESAALRRLENRTGSSDEEALYLRLESLLPDLLDVMREDLRTNPLAREFVILKRNWSYNTAGPYIAYYYEDHTNLDNKLVILQNHGLIQDVTRGNVKRYRITEALAIYLEA